MISPQRYPNVEEPGRADRSADDERSAYVDRGVELLDSALGRFREGMVTLGMDEIVMGLRRLRDENMDQWRRFISDRCRAHPIAEMLRQDPFTHRSAWKPRGYAGDAEMLDFIFSPETIPALTTPLGASIFSYTTDGPAPRSVRARAAMMARTIDRMAAERPLRVLAVMSGHLWEARLSKATRSGGVEKYLAFDQDARTLAAIDTLEHLPGITTYQGNLRSLFRGRSVFRNFDLLYSPLCDNLTDTTASRFISTLFDAVAPGGRLIISNFAPELVDAGYMEAFMEWNLIYRDETGLAKLAAGLPGERVAACETYRDPHGNIAFLELTREG
ncbi:MAG: methyltransferase type 12 [Chlorobi bacterium]|nr:methyltransferase type 12 [Chlorobiota bacterium]